MRPTPFLAIAATLSAASVFLAKPAEAQVQTNPTANLPATRLKVTTNLVVVRVVVRDAQGKPVNGLRKEDFKLFDSGKEQSIAQFEAEPAIEPPSPPVAHTPEQAGTRLSPTLPGRFLSFYFDDLYTSDADMVYVRQAADDYLAANLRPADRVAIFTSDKMLSDFTSDPKQIHEALSRLKSSPRALNRLPDCPELSDYQALEITRTRAPQPFTPPLERLIAMNAAWGLAFESAAERKCLPANNPLQNETFILGRAQSFLGQAQILTRSNLQQLQEVVKYTAQMPGQRIVIFSSPGFVPVDENQFQLERIVDQALRSQVVISSLDPRGLPILARQADASLDNIPSAVGSLSGTMHLLDLNREVVATGPLVEMAAGTGGEYFHNNNDLKAGFGRLAGSPGSYILAFSPTDLKPDGKYHGLKVALAEKRTGYTLLARRGYFAPKGEAEAKAEAKAAEASSAAGQVQEQMREVLLAKAEIAQFPVVLDEKISAGQGETHELFLSSHVDPKSLHLQKEGNHNFDTLTFVFGVFDQKENLVIAQKRHATVDVADQQLPEFLEARINVDMAFQLKPGGYRIREVVTDSEQRMSAFSRNIDIPKIIPATPAASATPLHPPLVPAPQTSGQSNAQPALPSQTPITQPAAEAISIPPNLPPPSPPQPAAAPEAVAPSTSDLATDQLLLRVWDNFAAYLATLPNVFADEHVISSVTTPPGAAEDNGNPEGALPSTVDTTIDSVFRLKRVSTDGKAAGLIESREIRYVDHHAAAKDQSLIGPAIFAGGFSRAPNVFAPPSRTCYDYRLLPNKRHNPDIVVLFRHADVLVLEYALKSPLPPGAQCPAREQTKGRAYIDPSSMQIVRLEQQRPRHEVGPGLTVDWSWTIDYARVVMNGKPFWLPKTISSKASSLDRGVKWSFLANYSNYHLMTVTSTILPAADSSQP